jgi:type III restriction enzyme
MEKAGVEWLYFVVETKSSVFTDDLRDRDSARIECGKAHFKALAVGESLA